MQDNQTKGKQHLSHIYSTQHKRKQYPNQNWRIPQAKCRTTEPKVSNALAKCTPAIPKVNKAQSTSKQDPR